MAETDAARFDAHFAEARAQLLAELNDFIRIPSVSALPVHREDMVRAAEWVAARLRAAGVPTVKVLPTGGHPVVWGHWPAAEADAPIALIYAHYDTQPADPFDLWITPPFEPAERDGRLYARGASDDKGNLLIPIAVTEAFAKLVGRPPIGLVFLFEGEEEIGSPSLRALIEANRDRLRSDVAISADSAMWSQDGPSLVVGSKGLAGLQLDARGASGGPALGPARRDGPEPAERPRHDRGEHEGARRADHDRGVLRRGAPADRAGGRRDRRHPLRRGGLRGLDRHRGAGRRPGVQRAGAQLGAPDLRPEWHLGRLSGRRLEDGHPGRGAREDHMPSR